MHEKQEIKKYRLLSYVLMAILPIILYVSSKIEYINYGFVSCIFIIISIMIFLLRYETKNIQARQWIPLVVMAALAALGRAVFAPVPFFKPTSAIIIITGAVFGAEAGFMTGAIAALSSNLFFGQGPWTPWQMFSWGLIGFLAGMLIKGKIIKSRISICIFGGISGYIFGWIMNVWTALSYVGEISFSTFIGLYISSFPMDTIHSAATVIFLVVLYDPWTKKLRRLYNKVNK